MLDQQKLERKVACAFDMAISAVGALAFHLSFTAYNGKDQRLIACLSLVVLLGTLTVGYLTRRKRHI